MVFDAFITTEGELGECFRERVTIRSLFFLPVYKFVMPARVSVLLGNASPTCRCPSNGSDRYRNTWRRPQG